MPKGPAIHLILDNYATHGHPNVKAWLARHPAFTCTSPARTSSSWPNLVERWSRDQTDKAIRWGVLKSVPDQIAAIEDYPRVHNEDPKPFTWAATAEQILTKVQRGRITLAHVKNQN